MDPPDVDGIISVINTVANADGTVSLQSIIDSLPREYKLDGVDSYPETLKAHDKVTVICPNNHKIFTTAANIKQCRICIQHGKSADDQLNPACDSYTIGGDSLVFKCRLGHLFTTDQTKITHACPTCELRDQVRERCDAEADLCVINDGPNTLIRFKCTCDKEFCATPRMLESSAQAGRFQCADSHIGPPTHAETVRKVLEFMFDERFDDHHEDSKVKIIAYSKKIEVAVCTSKYTESVARWADANKIKLVVADKCKLIRLIDNIRDQLCTLNVFDPRSGAEDRTAEILYGITDKVHPPLPMGVYPSIDPNVNYGIHVRPAIIRSRPLVRPGGGGTVSR